MCAGRRNAREVLRTRPSDFANVWLWSAPRLRGRLRAVGNMEHGLRRTSCPRILASGVEHPLWSDTFEVRGLASEDRRPEGGGSVRLFASNWIFGHTLGLCYSKKVGAFFVYMTNPQYKVDIETKRGVLVISPLDREGLTHALSSR